MMLARLALFSALAVTAACASVGDDPRLSLDNNDALLRLEGYAYAVTG